MVYFASRVFDRSSHFLSFGAAVWATSSTVRTMINKRSRDEVTVAILLISLVVQSLLKKLLAVPQITRICDVIHQELVSFRVVRDAFTFPCFYGLHTRHLTAHSSFKYVYDLVQLFYRICSGVYSMDLLSYHPS